MDRDTVAFLAQLVADRLERLEAWLPDAGKGRGRQLVALSEALYEGCRGELEYLVELSEAADEAELQALATKLLDLRLQLTVLHAELSPFLADIGRRDVPVGLLHFVDGLIEALLPNRADPVIHLDPVYTYRTYPMVERLQGILSLLGVNFNGHPRPIVFSVPELEPSNALQFPLLSHEVAHIALDQKDIWARLAGTVDQDALRELLEASLKKAPGANLLEWKERLDNWVEELLCDGIASALSGPAFLWAMAVFLPLPKPGQIGSHPLPADRVRLILEHMDALGWMDQLLEFPQLHGWVKNAVEAGKTPVAGTAEEEFLRGAIKIVGEPIREMALSAVIPLSSEEFAAGEQALGELIAEGVPPAQVGPDAPSPFGILLAVWVQQLRRFGDSPQALAQCAGDTELNRFATKSLELAGVVNLWSRG